MTGPLLASYIVLWLFVAVLVVAVVALYHHFAQMYLHSPDGRATQGPEEGRQLAALAASDLLDNELTLPGHRPAIVIFSSVDCPLCGELRLMLSAFADGNPDLDLVVICAGEDAEVREWAAPIASPVRVVADARQRISARYSVGLIPFGMGVDAAGVVRAKGIVNAEDGLKVLADSTRDREPAIHVTVRNGGEP
jgi:hypothetical protein